MVTIDVLVFDGVDELDALGPYEVFANAGLDVALVTLEGARMLTGAHGVRFAATDGPRGADVLLVPGGGWNDRADAGAFAEAERGAIPAAVRAAHAAGTTIASVCTGAMLLAAAGLLRGRPAVTHAGALDELAAGGADVRPDARVVDAGDVVSCGGVTAGLDLALHLVARLCGREVATAVARQLEHEPRGALVCSDAAGGRAPGAPPPAK